MNAQWDYKWAPDYSENQSYLFLTAYYDSKIYFIVEIASILTSFKKQHFNADFRKYRMWFFKNLFRHQLGLYQTSRPVRKSGKFLNSGLSRTQIIPSWMLDF